MAVDLRQTILGDVRSIINDAWDFFAPPLIKLGIVLFFFWYICGSGPLYILKDTITKTAPGWDTGEITGFLDKYNLNSLLPIVALFLLAIFAYVINRIIFGVAELLPVNIYYTGDRIERMIQQDSMMQEHLDSLPSYSGYMLIDFALAKARSKNEEALLRNVNQLQKEVGKNYGLFSFAKFLLAWMVACCVLSLTVSGATAYTGGRVSLLGFTIIVFGIYAASKYAKSLEYLGYAQIHLVRLMLMGDDYFVKSKPFATVDYPVSEEDSERREQREMRIEELKRRDWWFLRLGLMDWWEVLRFFRHYDPAYRDSDSTFIRQTLLRNSLNILWFIIAALLIVILGRFSWWLGVGLFVGYVSITIVDCVLAAFLIGAVIIKSLISTFKSELPAVITDLLPAEPKRAILITEDNKYRFAVAAVRLVEAVLAVIFCRILAAYLF